MESAFGKLCLELLAAIDALAYMCMAYMCMPLMDDSKSEYIERCGGADSAEKSAAAGG